MTVEVEVFDDLDTVERDAAGALDRATQGSLFDRIAWLRLTARHFPALRPLICRAEAGSARAWLFLARDRRHASAFGSWYTLDFAPVFADSEPDGVKRSLLVAIAERLRGTVATMILQPLQDAAADLLQESFATAGWSARLRETSANWIASTEGLDGARYLAGRPSRVRNTLQRQARRHPIEVRVADGFAPDDWAAYEAVFARSWKPDEGSMAFLRDLAEHEGTAGTLRLGIGYRAGRPVAAQLWLVENGVAAIHKLAHDRAEDAGSPGTQLIAAMFAHVLDRDRPRRIGFGTGDDPYKSEWMDERLRLSALDLADPRTPRGLFAMARWKAALVRHRTSR